MSTRVLLVDDHAIVRAGLRITIAAQPDMEVVAEAGDASTALIQAQKHRPDLVLMDITLPVTDGIEISRKMLAQFPNLKIIILSAMAELDCVNRAIKAGVSGYMLKSSTGELAGAIRAVMAGHGYTSPEVTRLLLDEYRRMLESRTETAGSGLSEREMEILKLLAEGLRTKEIASRLNIGVKTVETYRARLLAKLKCESTIELVRYAIREGIAEA